MRTDDTRDRAVERLLRRSPEAGLEANVSPDCLDAETLAAWTDGSFRGAALATVEAHVAGCARCQSMAAVMIRTAPPTPVPAPWWQRTLRSTWLVPLTAGAAAVAIWAVVPSRTTTPKPTVTADGNRQTADGNRQPADGKPKPAESKEEADAGRRAVGESRRPAARADEGRSTAPTRNELRDLDTRQSATATDRIAGVAPATPPAPAAAEAEPPQRMRETAGALLKQEAFALEVRSPDPAVRWRLGAAGAIDRSEDGGTTWMRLQSGVTVQLTAGASSSSQTCWLVGASGTVLRTTDGRTWVSVNLPEPVDLIAVEAVDAAIAVVTAADGRRFRTSNGGQSWTRI